jgi:hypothetical protein
VGARHLADCCLDVRAGEHAGTGAHWRQPLDSNETFMVSARSSQRKDAMAALDLPWRSRCGEDRRQFISGINEYYFHRQNQTERYPEIHGKLGANYIAGQWSTGDDQRIDRLTQEAYARGYLKQADFDGGARRYRAQRHAATHCRASCGTDPDSGAISHHLQTPITRMQLRTDFLADTGSKEKLQGDLQEMQTLVKQGLALARGHDDVAEQLCQTDLYALVDSLVCDYSDAGNHLRLVGQRGVTILTHPQALRHIMSNLIDNGLKFGKDVEVAIDEKRPDRIGITVSDRGPGIPDEHLKSAFLPFYRIEASRNRETGGTGLGLAIALQLANALHGTLALVNRSGGGLEARLEFPR